MVRGDLTTFFLAAGLRFVTAVFVALFAAFAVLEVAAFPADLAAEGLFAAVVADRLWVFLAVALLEVTFLATSTIL